MNEEINANKEDINPIFDKKKENEANISQITLDVKQHINEIQEFKYDTKILEEIKNFVATPYSIERIKKISHYISIGVPVLLEGPSGTAKTFSAEIACLLLETKKLIKFNMSSDTSPSDLIGKIIGDDNSLAGISYKEGYFLKAFKEGHPLLLDEINLASPSVLQYIEDSLDSKEISLEIPGMPLIVEKMNPNFSLIATQNPNKGLFENKRQNLGNKFMSKFQIITFPEFSEDELEKIAIGLGKTFGFKKNINLLKDLVKFHMKWSNLEEIKDDILCFTIREIAASVKAFSEGKNEFDTVMTIYGSRYEKDKKDKLINLLRTFDSFKTIKEEIIEIPQKFPNCFKNDSLLKAIKYIKFSLDNNRHIIISGNEGSGKTQLALWFAEWYINEKNLDKSNIFYCLCTEELKSSDLIGKYNPTNKNEPGKELIEWKSGFLLKAIENGGLVILDDINQSSPTVFERLNGLLDKKYDENENFNVPENPKKPEVNISSKFRLICIVDINKINKMSPSFVNRFDVIVLEDQLKSINENEKKELIRFLLINSCDKNKLNEIKCYKEKKNEKINTFEEEKENDNYDFSNETPLASQLMNEEIEENEQNYEEDESKEKETNDQNSIENGNIQNMYDNYNEINNTEIKAIQDEQNGNNFEEKFEPNDGIIRLIYEKSKDFKNIYKLSQFCRTIRIFLYFFKEDKKINQEMLLTFVTIFSLKILKKGKK